MYMHMGYKGGGR